MPVYCIVHEFRSRIEFDSFRLYYFIFKFKWFFWCYLYSSRDFLIFLLCFVLVVGCDHFIPSYLKSESIQFVFIGRIAIVRCSSTLDHILHFRYKFDSGTPHAAHHGTKQSKNQCVHILFIFWLSMCLALWKRKSENFLLKVEFVGFPFGLNRHRWLYRCALYIIMYY